VQGKWASRNDLTLQEVGIGALFVGEVSAWFCVGEIVGRGFTLTGYKVSGRAGAGRSLRVAVCCMQCSASRRHCTWEHCVTVQCSAWHCAVWEGGVLCPCCFQAVRTEVYLLGETLVSLYSGQVLVGLASGHCSL